MITLACYTCFRIPGPYEMRHSCTFAAVYASLVALSGCGLEDTGPSAFNPATDVDLTFSSFDLENTDTSPDNLANTRFWHFYRGIEPADDNADDRETAREIRRHIDIFIGATPSESGASYVRVRNPLDLMNQVLASGDRIEIRGFGSFSLHFREPRMGRNPKTGETVQLPGKYVPHFKPGKELRERVNNSLING